MVGKEELDRIDKYKAGMQDKSQIEDPGIWCNVAQRFIFGLGNYLTALRPVCV